MAGTEPELPDAPFAKTVPPKKVTTVPVHEAPDAPFVTPAPTATGEPGAYALDILKALGQAIARKGPESLVGGGGDIYNLLQGVSEWGGEKLGLPDSVMQSIREAKGGNIMPTSEDVSESTSQFIGEPYEPKTTGGQVVDTIGQFASDPKKGFIRNAVAPGLATEGGGMLGEQYGREDLGRLIGGLIGGTATGAAMRTVAGPQVSGERARLTKLLMDEGVDLTAGQVTGRKALKYAETGPYEGKPGNIAESQSRQFNRAALRKAGIDADEVTPGVLDDADASFGERYDTVVARAGGVPLDGDLETALLENVMDFERLTDGNKAVDGYFKRISDAAQQNGNVIPADVFKQISSEISRDLRKLRGNPQGNAELMDTLREFKSSMFDSIGRNGNPQVVADWKQLNQQYRNYKDIERAMYGPGEATKEGMISPAKLGTSVAQGDKAGTLRERGDLAGQAKAGQMLMTDLPQSGTTPRMLLPASMALAGNQLINGDFKGAAVTGAAAAAPAAISSAMTSRPVRTALIRQATNPLPLLDKRTALLAAMLAGQESQ